MSWLLSPLEVGVRAGFRYFRTERILEAEVLEDSIPRRMDLLRAEWRKATDAERKRYEEGLRR